MAKLNQNAKWDLQEYIATYRKEQDERYLARFLHYYEKTHNKNAQSYMRQFFMQEHFADLKQAYIAGLLKALSKYTLDGGTSFVSFKEYYAEREILDYIRSMRTGFTVQSLAEYAKLRKEMAVWDKYDRSYSDATIEAVAAELGETIDDTKRILLGGLLNENRVDLYQQYAEDDEAESTEEAHPDFETIFLEKDKLMAIIPENHPLKDSEKFPATAFVMSLLCFLKRAQRQKYRRYLRKTI